MFRSGSLLFALTPFIAFAYAGQSDKPPTEPAKTAVTADVTKPPDTGDGGQKTDDLTPEKRGDIFMARKMYREAVEQYQSASPSAIMLNKIGIAYHQMLDLDTARKYYERAIRKNSKYPEAVNNLGTIYYAKKNYGRAVRQYQKALKLSPESASIYSNLGTAQFARKKYKEAFEAYQLALKLDPEVFERRGSGGSLVQERSVEERSRFHYYMAKLYAKSGMADRTIQYIRKALEEGFKDRDKFLEEPEFAFLKDNAEFKELMSQEPRAL